MAEHNQQFETFQTWVNKASSWLTRRGPTERVVCFDTKGRFCTRGLHFQRAHDEGAFPIRWIWPEDGTSVFDALPGFASGACDDA